MGPADEPPPAPSSRSSSTEDFCYVFVVELERGPSGLGMGLIDGLVSGPLGSTGPGPLFPGPQLVGKAGTRARSAAGGSQASEEGRACRGRDSVWCCPRSPVAELLREPGPGAQKPEAATSPPAYAAGCPRALHPDPAPGQSRGFGWPPVPGRPHPGGERQQPDGCQLPEVPPALVLQPPGEPLAHEQVPSRPCAEVQRSAGSFNL